MKVTTFIIYVMVTLVKRSLFFSVCSLFVKMLSFLQRALMHSAIYEQVSPFKNTELQKFQMFNFDKLIFSCIV